MYRPIALCVLLAGPASAQAPDSTEAPPSAALIAQGRALYQGSGLCAACHGVEGRGLPGVGPDLSDGEWLHSDGSLDAIVQQILDGVPPDVSSSGIMMPPRGGGRLSDAEVRAVAAYVWNLRNSRG